MTKFMANIRAILCKKRHGAQNVVLGVLFVCSVAVIIWLMILLTMWLTGTVKPNIDINVRIHADVNSEPVDLKINDIKIKFW